MRAPHTVVAPLNPPRRRHGPVRAAVVALVVSGLWCSLRADTNDPSSRVITPPLQTSEAFAQFAAFFEILAKHYVEADRVRPGDHTGAAIRSYLRSLDPEAVLLPSPRNLMAIARGDGPLVDIGALLSTRQSYPTIITTHEGSPAQKAGLIWGDQIRAVNGRSMENADQADCFLRLNGPAASSVELTVYDPGLDQNRTIVLQRALPAGSGVDAPARFLSHGVAYRRLSTFNQTAVESLREDLARIESERARGLILDIRNNGGGTFDATQIAAKLFLPAQAVICSIEQARPAKRAVFVSDSAKRFVAPVVLLVNAGTAGEAEIFAGALRDNKRARLVGATTFGLGRKLEQFALPDGSVLLLPTGRYLTPGNHEFHGVGLKSDVEIDLPRELERRLSITGFGKFDWLAQRAAILEADKQLARALELLR